MAEAPNDDIARRYAELGETVEGDVHYRVLFVIGLVLFAVTFAVNLTADLVVKGIRSERAA